MNSPETLQTPEKAPKPRAKELMRAAITAAFMALGTPQALAQEQQIEHTEDTENTGGNEINVSGSVSVASANTIPTNMIIDEDPVVRGTFRVDRAIADYTAAIEGQVNFDLRDGEFTNGELAACIERVYGDLFAKGCLKQGIDLRTFSATTQQAVGILANQYGVLVAGDYNLNNPDVGQYIEAGHEFSFTLGNQEFTFTPMVGHEPQGNYDYGYASLNTSIPGTSADLSFRIYGDEDGRQDASVALSVPLGGRN